MIWSPSAPSPCLAPHFLAPAPKPHTPAFPSNNCISSVKVFLAYCLLSTVSATPLLITPNRSQSLCVYRFSFCELHRHCRKISWWEKQELRMGNLICNVQGCRALAYGTHRRAGLCTAKQVVSSYSQQGPCRSKGSCRWELGKNSALARQTRDWTKGPSRKEADGGENWSSLGK